MPVGGGGAWLRCPWAVAGPGRDSRRRAEPKARSADGSRAGRRPRRSPAPRVWRAPEGPEGTGGLRGAAPNEVRLPSLAGGRALRRPEHQRGASNNQGKQKPQIPKDLRFHRARGGS